MQHARVGNGASIQQRRYDVQVSVVGRHVQGCVPRLWVPHVGVRARADEADEHVPVLHLGALVQRRRAGGVAAAARHAICSRGVRRHKNMHARTYLPPVLPGWTGGHKPQHPAPSTSRPPGWSTGGACAPRAARGMCDARTHKGGRCAAHRPGRPLANAHRVLHRHAAHIGRVGAQALDQERGGTALLNGKMLLGRSAARGVSGAACCARTGERTDRASSCQYQTCHRSAGGAASGNGSGCHRTASDLHRLSRRRSCA